MLNDVFWTIIAILMILLGASLVFWGLVWAIGKYLIPFLQSLT